MEQMDKPLLQAEVRDNIQSILDLCDESKGLLEKKFGEHNTAREKK